jgi:hypothetical protein
MKIGDFHKRVSVLVCKRVSVGFVKLRGAYGS